MLGKTLSDALVWGSEDEETADVRRDAEDDIIVVTVVDDAWTDVDAVVIDIEDISVDDEDVMGSTLERAVYAEDGVSNDDDAVIFEVDDFRSDAPFVDWPPHSFSTI